MIDRRIIEQLAAEELVDANTKHDPKFNSPHEAYAVIKEELEEMFDEAEYSVFYLGKLWEHVKADDDCTQQLDLLKSRAVMVAQEAIQVVAMCDKAMKLY